MKSNFLRFTLSLLLFSSILKAQNIEDVLSSWSKQNPIEKVYLHLDRESYYGGQTIWFKGYFMTDFVPSGRSSTLYVELINNQSTVILRNVFPAYLGATLGQIDIPDNLPQGSYTLRAYSPLMLNQPGFVFQKRLTIFGKENKTDKNESKIATGGLAFFPESGNFVSGIVNFVAFKSTDKNGIPVDVKGSILNDKGELVTHFQSTHDGMGYFTMIPLSGQNYYAVANGKSEKIALPQASTEGLTLGVAPSARGKEFKIQRVGDNDAFKPAYMIGQMENEVLFKQPLNGDKKEIHGVIETTEFFSGILQLTIFNKDNMPLAERITFVDNGEYKLPASFEADTLNTNSKGLNHFSVGLKDTIIGNFSVSVTDADYDGGESRTNNIYSWFLLGSNIKGYIHNPAFYFNSPADSVKRQLDLVMMTNGWTRFKWTEVANKKLPQPLFKDPGYISLRGKINIEGTRKTLGDKDIVMFMSPVDTTKGRRGLPQFIHTDSLGTFKIDSMIFYDKMKILFSDVKGKKSKYIKVKLDDDSLWKRYPIVAEQIPFSDSSMKISNKMTAAYDDFMRAEGQTLSNVTVKARQKTELQKLDEEYASGLFSGGINSRTLDLRNEIISGGSIFQYLVGRIAGLSITGGAGNYTVSFRGGGFGGGNVTLFLDEMQTDANMIENIPVAEIAMVKLLPNSVATPGGGTALAIYTKKGADLRAAMESPTDIINYNGYTIIKEFYNPDYATNPENDKADTRLTLSWNPNWFITEVNPKIPIVFYNNDRTKRFKIVVEGVTTDGRMLMLEKTVGDHQ